jgi:PAT family beta-lactamase induction signal transducer AmpG
MADSKSPRLTTWQSLKVVAKSWRLASVTLLAFASSLPLGLVWIAIPAWMARIGVDIKVVGIFVLAQAPWSFKFLWSPLMDRYPLPFLGRKRGWVLFAQIVLLLLGLGLAGAARHPDVIWVIGALALATAFASATQDIAYDAYTVEVLRQDEYGLAVGARGLLGRGAMWISGGIAITVAEKFLSWPTVNLLLALCYLPMMVVTWFAPEPESLPPPPKTLREAVWEPFVGLLAQHRALEILAFLVLYKFSDNLAQALLRPFFVQVGFDAWDVGVGTMSAGTAAIIIGTAAGGVATVTWGLGRALWIFGILQSFAHLGYAVVAQVGTNRPILYIAQVFEMGTGGLATGALSVLMLRLTQKRFSATHYALLSSLMSISRVVTGPPAALLVDAVGWRNFFVLTVFTGIPGMVMLQRFVPWSVREPVFGVAAPSQGKPLTTGGLTARGLLAALLSAAFAVVMMAALAVAKAYRAHKPFSFAGEVLKLIHPASTGDWLTTVGIAVFALLTAVSVAAALAARRGMAARPVEA